MISSGRPELNSASALLSLKKKKKKKEAGKKEKTKVCGFSGHRLVTFSVPHN